MGRKSNKKRRKKIDEIENFVFSGLNVDTELEKNLKSLTVDIYNKYNTLRAYKLEVEGFLDKYINNFNEDTIDDFEIDYNNLVKPYFISDVTYDNGIFYRYMNEDKEYYSNKNIALLYSNPKGMLGRVNNEARRMLYVSICPNIAQKEAGISSTNKYSSINYEINDKIKLLHFGFKRDINNESMSGLFNKFWTDLLSNENSGNFYQISNKIIDIFEIEIKSKNFDGIIWKSKKVCNNLDCEKENIALFHKSEKKITPRKLFLNNSVEYDIVIDNNSFELR